MSGEPMISRDPECGAPCDQFEALAHDNARLRAEVARLNESIQRHGNANDQLLVENTALRAEVARLREALVPLLRHRPDGSIGWRGHKTAKCGWLLVEDILRIEQALGREYADTARAAIDAARKGDEK